MRNTTKPVIKHLLFITLVLSACLSAASVFALDSTAIASQGLPEWAERSDANTVSPGQASPGQGTYYGSGADPQLRSVVTPLRWAQNDRGNFRSKSEVVKEVKRRYNAKVLKISLNEQRGVYNVRVLMPSGKVRNIQVNARR